MRYETLSLDVGDRIGTLTINRPDKLNALNARTIEELSDAIDALGRDANVGGIVLTGAGRAFVAGADIAELQDHGAISRGRSHCADKTCSGVSRRAPSRRSPR